VPPNGAVRAWVGRSPSTCGAGAARGTVTRIVDVGTRVPTARVEIIAPPSNLSGVPTICVPRDCAAMHCEAMRKPITRIDATHPLAKLPARELHPFKVYLLARGVDYREAAALLECSIRTLAAVVSEWRRPRQAAAWCAALGVSVDDLFPMTKGV